MNLDMQSGRREKQMLAAAAEQYAGKLTVQAGCLLGYHASESAAAMFMVQPYPNTQHIMVRDNFTTSTGAKVRREIDCHGNVILRTTLVPGYNEFRHEAVYLVPDAVENNGLPADTASIGSIPFDVLRYTLPSRYCESDKLSEFALREFGQYSIAAERAQAICDWVHTHIEYRYGSGNQSLSAWDVMERGYGICRDFAHVTVALCRALDIPARYVAGYVPRLIELDYPDDSDIGIDFHAYTEIWLGGCWHTFDARHNKPLKGRIKVAHGMDATDTAIATFYGRVDIVTFQVWSQEVKSALLDGRLAKAGMKERAR